MTTRLCRNRLCRKPIPEEKLRARPDAVYCDDHCYRTDPDQHARLRALNTAQWDADRAGCVARLHSPTATEKRSEAISWSNHFKPRRKRKS